MGAREFKIMPLKKGAPPGSRGFGQNIATEIKAGKPPKQAEAIAYREARADALQPSPFAGPAEMRAKKMDVLAHGVDVLASRMDALVTRADARKEQVWVVTAQLSNGETRRYESPTEQDASSRFYDMTSGQTKGAYKNITRPKREK